MRTQGAASVSVVALLDKVARRVVDLKPDYRGFEAGSLCISHLSMHTAGPALGAWHAAPRYTTTGNTLCSASLVDCTPCGCRMPRWGLQL